MKVIHKKSDYVVITLAGLLFFLGIFFPRGLRRAYNAFSSPVWVADVVDIGRVPVGKTTTYKLSVLNLKPSSIKIKATSGGCGCSVLDYSADATIRPFQREVIKISVTPGRSGKGSETVNLTSDGTEQAIGVNFEAI